MGQDNKSDDRTSNSSTIDPTQPGGCELFLIFRSAVSLVFQTLRHPLKTIRHSAGFCSLAPYREVNEGREECTPHPAVEIQLSTAEAEENNNEPSGFVEADRLKRKKPSKKIKKNLRKGVQHLGTSSLLFASPISSASIACDIHQRMSSNYKYAEMQEAYVTSTLFL
ncbi:uncharacterized protein [Asterias amurensis]|uniref:uncharacterized protein n=1 Tax=Asterias amurensis TaxID=7602 RepID=UPI003AB6A922